MPNGSQDAAEPNGAACEHAVMVIGHSIHLRLVFLLFLKDLEASRSLVKDTVQAAVEDHLREFALESGNGPRH